MGKAERNATPDEDEKLYEQDELIPRVPALKQYTYIRVYIYRRIFVYTDDGRQQGVGEEWATNDVYRRETFPIELTSTVDCIPLKNCHESHFLDETPCILRSRAYTMRAVYILHFTSRILYVIITVCSFYCIITTL